MLTRFKLLAALTSIAVVMCAAERPASAISVELAKKCRAMAIKAHPYKLPGEKGPGSAQAERDYYAACLAKGGQMPDDNSKARQTGSGNAGSPRHCRQSNRRAAQSVALLRTMGVIVVCLAALRELVCQRPRGAR